MVIQFQEKIPVNFLNTKELINFQHFDSIFRDQIPPKSLTSLDLTAIIKSYNLIHSHPNRILFRQTFPPCLCLTYKLKKRAIFLIKFIMYQFNVKGDMGRHHLSISGASSECGISTSTINRSAGKTFPPKVNLSQGRVAILVYQIEEWLNGKRGGWQ